MESRLLNRQKVLMLMLEELQNRGIASKTFLVKSLFLLGQEGNADSGGGNKLKLYSFYPYKYGPFSSLSYDDLIALEKRGYITKDRNVTERGRFASQKIRKTLMPKIKSIVERFNSQEEIKRYVYKKYPEYTVRSELLPKTTVREKGICTIGYEGKDIDEFLNMLIKNNVTVLADIRHNPFSMNPSYRRESLKSKLESAGIRYIHIKNLGIEGSMRKGLVSTEAYTTLFREYSDRIRKNPAEIEQLTQLGGNEKLALLCFENDKNMCHRGIVTEELEKKGIAAVHL